MRRRLYKSLLWFGLCFSLIVLINGISSFPQSRFNRGAIAASSPFMQVLEEISPHSLTQNVRRSVLDNGLTILTKEVHTAPIVSVQVWYNIGSGHEAPQVNGIAHQLEHMLFRGTVSRPVQFGRLFSALGSQSNAFTSYDNTGYVNTVERHQLEAVLALEADRMQQALLAAEDLDREKRVVVSEIQGYENSPDYRLRQAVLRAALVDHPYALPIGGTRADVEQFTVEQVRQYYQDFYQPNNAVLVIVGDFQTEPILQQVQALFGAIPGRSATPTRSTSDIPDLLSQIPKTPRSPIVLREPGSVPLLDVVYPLPGLHHPDGAALDVLDYIMDNGGRSSRIYQTFVDSGLAVEAGSFTTVLKAGGWYTFSATAANDADLAEVEQTFQQVIQDLQQVPVTAEELDRAKATIRADLILGNRDLTSQAIQLGEDEVTAGDYQYSDRYLASVNQVTAADVQRVAQTYLTPAQGTVGFFYPSQLSEADDGVNLGAGGLSDNFQPSTPTDPAEVAQYLPPLITDSRAEVQALPEEITLANGLRILLFEDQSTPTLTLSGYIQAGSDRDPQTKIGLAELTAENLMSGTRTQNHLALAQTLENRGASLEFHPGREGVYFKGLSLAADQSVLLETLADVLQQAVFPAEQFNLSRQQNLTELKSALDNPWYVGWRKFQETLYPEGHPFRQFETEATLRAIRRADLVRFYQQYYRPDHTLLALVGSFNPEQTRSQLEALFSGWQSQGTLKPIALPSVEFPMGNLRLRESLPGKSEAITYLGHPGIDRHHPQFYQALILNDILGSSTLSSRLGMEIRDRLGLTYGIYSDFNAGRYAGPFTVSMQTAPSDTEQAIATTLTLLQQMRAEGVTPAEIDMAKRSIISSYRIGLADPDYFSDTLIETQVDGLPLSELHEFTQKVNAISQTQVNQAAQDLLNPDRMVIVTVEPA